jgi:hypothetical protein
MIRILVLHEREPPAGLKAGATVMAGPVGTAGAFRPQEARGLGMMSAVRPSVLVSAEVTSLMRMMTRGGASFCAAGSTSAPSRAMLAHKAQKLSAPGAR